MRFQSAVLAALLGLATAAPSLSAREAYTYQWSVTGLEAACTKGDTGSPSVCHYQFTVGGEEVAKDQDPKHPAAKPKFEFQCKAKTAQNDVTENYCNSAILPDTKEVKVQAYLDLDKHEKTGNLFIRVQFVKLSPVESYTATLHKPYRFYTHTKAFEVTAQWEKLYTAPFNKRRSSIEKRRQDLELV